MNWPFWKPVVEVGRHAERGLNTAAFQHLGQQRTHRRPDAPKPMISTRILVPSLAQILGISFSSLAGQQSVALLRIELERIVFLQQVLHRIEIRPQRRIIRHRQRRHLRRSR